ncbi:MAG: glucosidase [Cytophagales bacterium]|nr:glucosidase [Armatimonadota bacterium]
MNEEQKRLEEAKGNPNGWRHWGPYLAERAWGTVREDYSPDGSAWSYLPHDHARSRAYRWNEDGIAGISDIRQHLCFALALWNGNDPILKERIFGLTGPEGNHGEDPKEYYFFQDATPTHSYLKYHYMSPHADFPNEDLVKTNRARGRHEPEYELLDTGAFHEDRYFDVTVEYAKKTEEDLCIRITVQNRGPEAAVLHLLPTAWFRNTWSWGHDPRYPHIDRQSVNDEPPGVRVLHLTHHELGTRWLSCQGTPDLLFCENETNFERLFGTPNPRPYPKDGINDHVVAGKPDAVSPEQSGTKAAAWYRITVPAGGEEILRLRLSNAPFDEVTDAFGADFAQTFMRRIAEADAFYHDLAPAGISEDAKAVQRQAYAGLIWSKQYYRYDVEKWLNGDPAYPPPPRERRKNRNANWHTFDAADILSMPDTWEYPWFAAWDLAFHMIPFAQLDPDFAKHQLTLLCREWYMHPNGQLAAYEWAFGDVNPPVHAWAALRVYQIERKAMGIPSSQPGDVDFLERIFHKLLLNFTWWVNRKDAQGNNVFEGGFLGLDNIGVFDRSAPLPTGGYIEQCDGTAWMAMYCLNMLGIALELCRTDPTYEDVATKFAEHYIYIAHALNDIGEDGLTLWDEADGFYYDVMHLSPALQNGGSEYLPLKVRSMVGLIPLFAVASGEADTTDHADDFLKRIDWFLAHKPHLAQNITHMIARGVHERSIFSVVSPDRLRRILHRVLDEDEFLAPNGIRALSRSHRDHPYRLDLQGTQYGVDYAPAESRTGLFGGNSNWRGPIWFPLNYLLIEALQQYDFVYGAEFLVEMPTGSGKMMTLGEVATELSLRLVRTFTRGADGKRPVFGDHPVWQNDPHWRDHLLFYEYFNGDTGAGLGANHQTGWTALVAKLISQSGC